jgi:hypothetical protein
MNKSKSNKQAYLSFNPSFDMNFMDQVHTELLTDFKKNSRIKINLKDLKIQKTENVESIKQMHKNHVLKNQGEK